MFKIKFSLLVLVIFILASCVGTKKGTIEKPETITEDKIEVSKLIRPSNPEFSKFCVKLNVDFAYSYAVSIYNTKMEVVWQSNNLQECWDGWISTGSGKQFVEGMYAVQIQVISVAGYHYEHKSMLIIMEQG